MDAKLKNSLILLPVVAGVLYASFLLYKSSKQDQMSVETEKKREAVGQVISAEAEVRRQYGDDVIWNPMDKDAMVFNKDSIRTGKDSGVAIKLNDGSVIELGENSLIVLDKSPDNLSVNFKAGDISAKNSSQKLQINLKDSQINAQGADLKIKTGANEKTQIEVAKGKASIIDKSKKNTDVNQDETADVDNGEVKNIMKIVVILNSPANKTQIKSNMSDIAQPFTWKVLSPDIKSEKFEYSHSDKFPQTDTTTTDTHQALTVHLTQGTYYWRVGWLGKDQKLLFTESRQIFVGLDNRLELIYPDTGTVFDLEPEENQVELRWNSRIEPRLYVAELATSKDFKNLALSHTVKETKDTVKDLPPQTYYWRVRAFGENNEELAASPVHSFSVKVRVAKLPELVSPEDEATVESSDSVAFTWKKMEKASEYRILISKDENQKEVVKSKAVTATAYNWKYNSQGPYYWSVRALSEKGTVVGQSEVRQLTTKTVPKSPAFELIAPKAQTEVVRDLTQTPEPVLLQWKILRPLPGPVSLAVSRDTEFKDSVHQDNLSKTSLPVRLHTPGVYYWKLTSKSEDEKIKEVSPLWKFTLKGTINLLSPEIIEPEDKNNVEAEHPQPVKFSWKPVAIASQYHIVVQRKDPRTNLLVTVLDRILKETTINSTPLPEGSYTWNLTSLDASGQEGLAGRPYQFTVVPPQLMDAPKLNAPVIK